MEQEANDGIFAPSDRLNGRFQAKSDSLSTRFVNLVRDKPRDAEISYDEIADELELPGDSFDVLKAIWGMKSSNEMRIARDYGRFLRLILGQGYLVVEGNEAVEEMKDRLIRLNGSIMRHRRLLGYITNLNSNRRTSVEAMRDALRGARDTLRKRMHTSFGVDMYDGPEEG